jgi:hypothetical protein
MTELEHALVALGRELEVPATPDLASAVMRQLAPRRRHWLTRHWLTRQWPTRPAAVAIAFVIIAALAATLAIPDARSALFRVLHIGGEEIQFVDELPQVESDAGLPYRLGRNVSLAAARQQADFTLRELDEGPDGVYLGEHGTVWFLYGTPERVRLLVAQTAELDLDSRFMFKLVSPDTRVSEVSVGGARGFFLSGAAHVVLLVDKYGNVIDESARLAKDVLIWSRGGITYRLEGDFDEHEAIHLAKSLH